MNILDMSWKLPVKCYSHITQGAMKWLTLSNLWFTHSLPLDEVHKHEFWPQAKKWTPTHYDESDAMWLH